MISLVFIILGTAFLLIAALGLLRMPDIFLRMHAATKAGTLGAGLVLLGVMIHFGEVSVIARAAATIVFLLITAPVAAHMLGRSAYLMGVPMWIHSVQDDLQERYDLKTHVLKSEEAGKRSG